MSLLQYLLLIPLAAAFAVPIFSKKFKVVGEALPAVATISLTAVSVIILSQTAAGRILTCKPGGHVSGLGIALAADGLSAMMLVAMNIVAFLVSVYSLDYMKRYTDTWKFYSLFMFMVSGINGVLVACDIFNMYVFLEIAAISGYFLVAFGVEAEELEAAFKYAVMGAVASAFILLGIAVLYSYASTLNMAGIAFFLSENRITKVVQFVSVLFFMGFGLKAALVPFHSWLPYAHSSAPAPVSAMLSGVSIKVLGLYALARILFNVLGVTPATAYILISLAVISMVVASILAFGQTDIKRLFAYSSISQVGYVALGLGIATPLSIFGAIFHLLNHSIFKSLLFLNSGAIERITGTRNLSEISSVTGRSPVTGYTGLTAAFSICGMPPLGGFWSKLIIILACIQANHPFLALSAALVSMLTLAYYFRALTPVLFGRCGTGLAPGGRISPVMAIPMVCLAVISVAIIFMLLPGFLNNALKDASLVLANGKEYSSMMIEALK